MANGEQRTAHDRRLVWLLIAAGLVGLWNCGVQDHGLILSPPEWKDGERAGYEIVRNDSVVYRTWLKVELSEEVAGVQGIRIPTVVVTSMVEPGEGGEYFFDSLTVVLRRDSLRPLRSYRSITSGVSELEVEARFDPGRAVITKTTVDGVQQGSVGLPKWCYSQDALGTLLRAVPLAPGMSSRTSLIVPVDFRVVPVKIQVLGTKLITTGLGDILCREVAVSAPGRETRFWIELAEPRRFVGLRDLQTGTVLRLVSYEPGGEQPSGREPVSDL